MRDQHAVKGGGGGGGGGEPPDTAVSARGGGSGQDTGRALAGGAGTGAGQDLPHNNPALRHEEARQRFERDVASKLMEVIEKKKFANLKVRALDFVFVSLGVWCSQQIPLLTETQLICQTRGTRESDFASFRRAPRFTPCFVV